MKKLLGKRFMFLVALLVGLCMPVVAQTTVTKAFGSGDYGTATSGDHNVGKNSDVTWSAPSSSIKREGFIWYTYFLQLNKNQELQIKSANDYLIANVAITLRTGSVGTLTVNTKNGNSSNGSFTSTSNSFDIADAANSVTITGTNDMQITQISVTYAAKGSVTTAIEVTGTKTLNVGESSQLSVTTNPNSKGAKSFTSNNPTVATVDNNTGKVTAKSEGTADIVVKVAQYGIYKEATKTVTITVKEGHKTLEDDGGTVYYIRNAATGLYIKYGGAYGMDAVEGRAAHPFKLKKKENSEKYSLASIHGYFNSSYSFNSLFLDRFESESNWEVVPVEEQHLNGYDVTGLKLKSQNLFYLLGESRYALTSKANEYGILELNPHVEEGDPYQMWEFVEEPELVENSINSSNASGTDPMDVTVLIKGAGFDYADHLEAANVETSQKPRSPFYEEIFGLHEMPLNSTPVPEYTSEGKDKEYSDWVLKHSYINNWDGFKRIEHYNGNGVKWSDDVFNPGNVNINGIGLSRPNIHNSYYVEQYIGDLPAGTYMFSYQGFYTSSFDSEHYNKEDADVSEKLKMQITSTAYDESSQSVEGEADLDYIKQSQNDPVHQYTPSWGDDRGYNVATILRDNREDDDYRNFIKFTLAEEKPVWIRLYKPWSNDDHVSGGDYHWMIAFDDFSLVYQGTGTVDNATLQARVFFERVKFAYLYYAKKVAALSESGLNYGGCDETECKHWDAWKAAIENVVKVDGVKPNGDPNTVTTSQTKIATLNGNNIDTEKEFLQALSKIAAAYKAAYDEHAKHAAELPGVISDPSFEHGGQGWENIGFGEVLDISDKNVAGTHENKYFSIGSGHQATNLARVTQLTPQSLAPGLYRLSALVATDGTNVTAYLVANGYYSGVSSANFDTFVEHHVDFLVEEEGPVRIAAVGHNNPYAPIENNGFPEDYPLNRPQYFPYGGSSYRADNFRISRLAELPDGRVQMAFNEAKEVLGSLDTYANTAAIQSEDMLTEQSLQAYINVSYSNDTDAKDAVAEIYRKLGNTVKAQRTKKADMTYAISDPSFEHGIGGAWTFSQFEQSGGDNGIYNNEGWIFTGSTGRKIFNTWQGEKASGPISQTITGLPNGTYLVTAVMACGTGQGPNTALLTANDVTSDDKPQYVNDNNIGELVSVITQVKNHTLVIRAQAKDGIWYKVDNFHLTFLYNELALKQENTADDVSNVKTDWYTDVHLYRPMTNVTWNSFVVPYNMPVPKNWDVRELTDGSINGTHLSMTFSRVSGEIKAGIPYMVRYYPKGVPENPALDVNKDSDTDNDDPGYNNKDERETYTTLEDKTKGTISSEYTNVDTSKKPTSVVKDVVCDDGTGTLRFVGSYIPTDIPEGAIFISDNKFYVSKGNSKIKGYRGYIVPEGKAAEARTFGMRTRGENSTQIESANNEEATVVGIYNVNGVKLNEIQDGLNILRMSDGTTIKILMQ